MKYTMDFKTHFALILPDVGCLNEYCCVFPKQSMNLSDADCVCMSVCVDRGACLFI